MIATVSIQDCALRCCAQIVVGLALLAPAGSTSPVPSAEDALYFRLTADFARLAPQTVHPAEGVIRFPYLIPAGYYPQMWDWGGFFIGVHWANQDRANAKYLR